MTTAPANVESPTASSPIGQGIVPGDGPPSAGDILAMLRRRVVLIFVLFILFTALAVAGFVVWWRYFPGYNAECLIECVSNIPEAELTIEQQRLRQEEHDRFVRTQALALKSPDILGQALAAQDVKDTAWYRAIPQRAPILLELTEQLRVTPVRGTNYLRVAMQCRRREDPRIIVNTVVERWHESVKRRSTQELASEPLSDAQEELGTVESEIAEARSSLREIAARLPAGARENPGNNIAHQQVRQYGEQVAQLTLELSQLEQFRQIYNDPEMVAVTAEDRAIVEADPQVAELARTLFLFQQQRAADAGVFGANHRVVKQLDARIEVTREELDRLRAEKFRERRDDIREATNTAYANTQHALFLAQENLIRAEAMLQDQDERLFSYQSLEAELTRKLEYQSELNDYINSLNRIVRQQAAVNINIAQPAIDPLKQASPSLFFLPIGVFLALALAVGIALSLELIDKSVRMPHDITRHVGVALLGVVPHTDDEEVAITRIETAVRDTPHSMVAEAFRQVRTNVRFSAPADRQRRIMITSPRPDDGKTTVAANLAIAIAQGGKRVLLVDANFRRPAIHKLFEQTAGKGLSNILVGDGSLADCVTHTDLDTLDVLGAGPIPPNPAELLSSETCRKRLEEAGAAYDHLIIDTPPILLASDALVLAPTVDGVVLVVRANENTRGAARRASTLLSEVNAHIFGAVLNAAQVTRGGYFREQLRTYYDYQPEQGPAGRKGSRKSPMEPT